jgi:hypothetical protein
MPGRSSGVVGWNRGSRRAAGSILPDRVRSEQSVHFPAIFSLRLPRRALSRRDPRPRFGAFCTRPCITTQNGPEGPRTAWKER